MGLTIQCNFEASRLLTGVNLSHIKQAAITYLARFGKTEAASLVNSAPGTVISPTSTYQPANIVYGDNYFTSSADNLSAGITASGLTKDLNATLFAAFNATAIPGSGARFREILSQWGDNPSTAANQGRFSIGIYTDAAGVNYVSATWGSGLDYSTMAIQYDWSKATTPISLMGSRDAAGNMYLEVRNGSTILKKSGAVTPVAIPDASTNWRAFAGQISSRTVTGQKIYSAVSWNGATLSPDEISAELDILKVNLAGYI